MFGYGITDISSLTLPTTLHKAVVQVISRQQCRQAIGRYQVLASDVVCAGGGASDACLGDSGSPLFCHRGDGSQVLAGIVSSGFNGCATAGVPGVYTSVAAHRDWIDWALSSVLLLSKT